MNFTSHLGSLVTGIVLAGLVFLATSAAQTGATPLGHFNGPTPEVIVANLADIAPERRELVRIDLNRRPLNGQESVLAYTVPTGKSLLLWGYTGMSQVTITVSREPDPSGMAWHQTIDTIPDVSVPNAWEAPLVFLDGESVYINNTSAGANYYVHLSLTGYLIDA